VHSYFFIFKGAGEQVERDGAMADKPMHIDNPTDMPVDDMNKNQVWLTHACAHYSDYFYDYLLYSKYSIILACKSIRECKSSFESVYKA
jgi:hypothetical protein